MKTDRPLAARSPLEAAMAEMLSSAEMQASLTSTARSVRTRQRVRQVALAVVVAALFVGAAALFRLVA